MALISVIIPARAAAATLPETIAALRAQTWSRWEAFVIVADAQDPTYATALDLARDEPRLQVVVSPAAGPNAARNHAALTLARGDVLAFCDADDIWEPLKLEQVAAVVLGGRAHAVFGRYGCFRTTAERVAGWSLVPMRPVTVPILLGDNPVGPLSNLSVARSVFVALGGLRQDMVQGADLEFLIRLVGEGYRLSGIDAQHLRYRLRPDGLSSDLAAMKAGRIKALRSALRLSYVPTAAGEAACLRRMAERALQTDSPARVLRGLVSEGVMLDARTFLRPSRRGAGLALAALLLPALPRTLRRLLFRG